MNVGGIETLSTNPKPKQCLNCRRVLLALFILALAPEAARAQLGLPGVGGAQAVITIPGSVVMDQAAEASLASIDATTQAILQADQLTATSLTTGGGGGDYQPNASFIANLDNTLFNGINPNNFNQWFPGWQALPPNSTDAISIPLTTLILTTYDAALADAATQAQELSGEDFTPIETTSATTTNTLTAIQANTEAQLASAQELQYIRQLLIDLVVVNSTQAAEGLNTRAQENATIATSFNLGVTP